MLLEQKQKVTQHFKRGSKKDGELRGLAGALAEYVAPRALKAHGLGEEHEHRMQLFLRWRAEMLVSNWGMATYQRWLARPVGDAGGDDHLAFMLEDAAHELAATICPAAGLDGQERELTEYLAACFQRDASELGGYLAWRAHQARQEAA